MCVCVCVCFTPPPPSSSSFLLFLLLPSSFPPQVGYVLSTIQSGAVGTQACNEAVSAIKGLVGDIETTAMFARAGALNREGQIGVFAEHRDQILETAKRLVDDTKRLVSSAASSQEQLAYAAQQAVKTITQEAEHVKLGASVLMGDDMGAQVR